MATLLSNPAVGPVGTAPNVAVHARTACVTKVTRKHAVAGIEFGTAGVKVSLTCWRRGAPELLQCVRRRYPPDFTFENPDIARLTKQLSDELPRLASISQVPCVVVLPSSLAIFGLQHAPSLAQATAIAAAEVYQGQVAACSLTNDAHATYTCPGPLAEVLATATSTAGYLCREVIAQPLAMRYAALLAGSPTAAVLDWGWQGSVLTLPVANADAVSRAKFFSRYLKGHGLAQLYQQTARAAGTTDVAVALATNQAGVRPQRIDQDGTANSGSAAFSGSISAGRRRVVDALQTNLRPMVTAVADQIRTTVRYAGRYNITPPSELLVCGGGAGLEQLLAALQTELVMPVRPWAIARESRATNEPSQAAWAVSAAAALMPQELEAW